MDRSILSIIVVMGALVGIVLFLIWQDDESVHETKPVTIVLPKSTPELSLSSVFPEEIKVIVGINNTVVWKNEDNITHNVELPTDERFHRIESNSSFSYTFNGTGVVKYVVWPGIDGYEEHFEGRIIVEDLNYRPPPQRISISGVHMGSDIDEPSYVQMKDFSPNSSAVFIYPYTGDKTLDEQQSSRWILIRLSQKYGGDRDDISSFRAYSMVDLYLWCFVKYFPDKELFIDPCHGTMYEPFDGIALRGPGKDYMIKNNALPKLHLGIDIEGYIYVKSPVFDVDQNGLIGYGRKTNTDALTRLSEWTFASTMR